MTDDDTRDPLAMIDALQPFFEALRGMVATFVRDGFTEQQARDLAVIVMMKAGNAG